MKSLFRPFLNMGREDPRQRKLPFEGAGDPGKSGTPNDMEGESTEGVDQEHSSGTASCGFLSIGAWFDSLASRTEKLGEHLECQNVWLDGAEE
ncbi:hypothetical protein NDU88_008083 [Pleurodeles waltl]|uniref:Uncharacterized protein n=1 Tax=Pleurodeles waltl TaxID=8319 RepID=A0AAV7NZ82_PLEWA|nr:hypothetical protein NDU88_008083 [Pleurodeles waltl]